RGLDRGVIPDRPIARAGKLAEFVAEFVVMHDARDIEPAVANVWLESLDAVLLGVPALAGRVQFLDRGEIVIRPVAVLDHFQVALHAVAFVANLDHLNARYVLPFGFEAIHPLHALVEPHAMAEAVEQILNAGRINADHRDRGSVGTRARALAWVD